MFQFPIKIPEIIFDSPPVFLLVSYPNSATPEFHVQSHPSGDGKSTVKFIKYLQNKYKNRKIILIWEGASYHKYGEFRDFLLEVNGDKEPDDWSITCILFAPNDPQQNPVEDIWLQAKNFLRKYW